MKQYKEYKDSGVKWIGKIPSHWKAVQLRRITKTVRTGTTPSGVSEIYFNKTGLCWFTPSDFENNYVLLDSEKHLSALGEKKVKIFPKNSILMIGIGGTMGKVALAKVQCASNQQINAIIPNNNVNPMFLVYYLKCMQDNIFKTARFTTLPILNQLETKKIPISIPPLFEQQAIATYLDNKVSKIDKYISTAEKKIAALDELKQVTIADAVTHGINPNAPMKDSGSPWIGIVPEHWEIKRIAIIFSENKDKNSKYEFSHAFKFNYGTLVPKNEAGDVSEYRETYEAYTIIKKDDIAINCLNLNYDFVSQRVAISPNKGILTSAYLIITPRQCVNPYYYNYLFKSMDSKKMFHGMGTGIRLTLSYTELKKQFLPSPPLFEQNEIVAYIDHKVAQIDKVKASELAQIEKLKEYKQRLISDVVTGKVKVTND